MTKKQRAAKMAEILAQNYPATCSLVAKNDYELLFATRLSAQCTDARVNLVTAVLFDRYKTIEAIANADIEDLCEIIKPCGLFRTKASDLKSAAQIIVSKHGGRVPEDMEDLLALPGIGRKTANLVRSDFFGHNAIVTDTHCIRITGKIGLHSATDPYKVELELVKLIEPSLQSDTCHRLVHFGRDICTARAPKCHICPMTEICKTAGAK